MYVIWRPEHNEEEPYVAGWDYCYRLRAETLREAFLEVEEKVSEGFFRYPPNVICYGPRKTHYIWRSGPLTGFRLQESLDPKYVVQTEEWSKDLTWQRCIPLFASSLEDAIEEVRHIVACGDLKQGHNGLVYHSVPYKHTLMIDGIRLMIRAPESRAAVMWEHDPEVFFIDKKGCEEDSWLLGYSTEGFLLREGHSLERAIAEAEYRASHGGFYRCHTFHGYRYVEHWWNEGPLNGYRLFRLKGGIREVEL